MGSRPLESLSTEHLIKQKRLNQLALLVVFLGAGFAIGASLYRLAFFGELPITTLYGSIVALVFAIPSYYYKKRIEAELEERNNFV